MSAPSLASFCELLSGLVISQASESFIVYISRPKCLVFGVEIQAAPNLRDGFDASYVNMKHDGCGARQRFQTRTQPGLARLYYGY